MTDLFGKSILLDTSKRRRRTNTNPLLPIYGTYTQESGQKCKNCGHLKRYRNWFKCALRRKGGPATDHQANYKACGKFVAILPTCPGCGAERLDECNCPLKQ